MRKGNGGCMRWLGCKGCSLNGNGFFDKAFMVHWSYADGVASLCEGVILPIYPTHALAIFNKASHLPKGQILRDGRINKVTLLKGQEAE